MIQTLFCKNGGHYYDRVSTRGRQAVSCVNHDGTGIPVKTYRAGSKAGEIAFQKTGGAVKARLGAGYFKAEPKKAAVAPRAVPVKVVAGSGEGTRLQTLTCAFGPHEWTRVPKRGTKPMFCPEHRESNPVAPTVEPSEVDEYPVAITLDDEFTYQFDTQSEDHAGQFHCESCGEWKPRKSNRGRVQKTCDECKELPAVQVAVAANLRANAEERGERIATNLENLLRIRGTHLSQNGERFQLQRWVTGRTWENLKVTADNWGVKHWAMDDANAHMLKIKRMRWVKINESELASV